MAGNTSAGAGESSAQDRSGSQDSGVSAPRGARTNQGSLIKEVLKNFTVEKFKCVDRVEGAARPDLRCRNVDAGEGAVRAGGARRNQKNGANMVADLSDNNPKSNGGAEKKKERTAGQFFHIGEQGEQGDASAKVGAELHPLDYWVLDTGAAWTMTPRNELLDDVRAAPMNEVCSASGHALKVAGAGRAAFKGADGKPVY
ncbi:unnamed protein product [Closterium sp. NIES-53]